ncbi:MAG: hypothetical protein HY773_00530 [Candidatus Terrybacteria bacterium]|nr:hypothetical protein [Candidatus Terrybacteria bacterium]
MIAITGTYSFIINLLGIVSGFLFTVLIIKDRVSLSSKLPKSYFTWMTIGAIVFTLGFVFDLVGYLIGEDLNSIHHLALIIAGMIFIFYNMTFLQEMK